MTTYSTVIGIDVSKDTLDIAILFDGKKTTKKIKNKVDSIKEWIKSLPANVLCVLEPTGSYSDFVLYHLNQNKIPVSLVNPSQSHGFAQALGIISKNDKQAAYTLALMAQRLDLPLHQPKSDDMLKRKQLLMGITALKKQKQVLVNQLHALEHQIIFAPKVQEAFKQTLELVEKQLSELEAQLNEVSDEEHSKQLELILTVVGIGPKTAHTLMNATSGINNFKVGNQLSKFAGVVPLSHESGISVHYKGGITKRGNNELRANLFMAARSAKRYNLACKDLYERLRKKGKAHKKAMVAVMNKLLKQVFGVVTSGVPFNNKLHLLAKEQ
jgi:transposase